MRIITLGLEYSSVESPCLMWALAFIPVLFLRKNKQGILPLFRMCLKSKRKTQYFLIFVSWSLIWFPINLFPSWNPMTSSSLLFSIFVLLCSKARSPYVAQRSLKATPVASVSRLLDYRCAAPGLTPCSQTQVWLQLIRKLCLCPYTDKQSHWNWTLCAGLTRQRTRATSCLLRFLVIKLI